MPTPDFFTALTGWRRFGVRDRGRVLVSVNHPIPWATADLGPACCLVDEGVGYSPMTDRLIEHPRDEPCPALGCLCG